MKTNYKEFVILTSDLSYMSGGDNRKRLRHLKNVLDDLHINYKDCFGYYNGSNENSLYIELNHALGFTEDFFTELACNTYDQECILHRDKYNNCYLLKPCVSGNYNKFTKNKTYVGKFNEIEYEQFLRADNATEINGKFYTTTL